MRTDGLPPDAAQVEAVEQLRDRPDLQDEREWIAGCPIHPAASLLPMIEDEDLEQLAEDIRQFGLRVPIVRTAEGEIIDGRNRLLACEMAEVTPAFVELNGEEPYAYVESLNLERRHLNRSQRAMLVAYLRYLRGENGTGSVSDTAQEAAETAAVSEKQINRCNVIIKHAPELIREVIEARMTVAEAYDQARSVKDVKTGRREMEIKVQTGAPDLWQLVSDGSMSLPEAVRCLDARQREELAHALSLAKNMSHGFRVLDPGEEDIEEQARHWLTVNPQLLDYDDDFTANRARRIGATLTRYAELKEEIDATK